jgi:D-glycero-D-manno-heptose 1,7-bisphosphate phosphatase
MQRSQAVFLDRDGTLIEEAGYLERLDQVRLFPWTIDAVRLLNRAGFVVVVTTNQAGIARGFFSEAFVQETHRYLDERFAEGGARIDRYYYCPHHLDGKVEAYRVPCDCRKPQAGMARRAASELNLDLSRSFAVGDKWSDVGLGEAIGGRGLLVRTGVGRHAEQRPRDDVHPAAIVDNVMAAVAWILADGQAGMAPRPYERSQG